MPAMETSGGKTAAFAVWFVPAIEGGSKTAAFAVWFVQANILQLEVLLNSW